MRCNRLPLAFAVLTAAFTTLACGGTDPGWIGGPPGAHDSTSTAPTGSSVTADAGKDAEPGYRDPKKPEAGCVLPNLVCGGACLAVNADRDHCGACTNKCIGNDSACLAGKCACSGPLIDYCDNVGCMDVSKDLNNCGACGNVCDPNQFDTCVNGVCVLLN